MPWPNAGLQNAQEIVIHTQLGSAIILFQPNCAGKGFNVYQVRALRSRFRMLGVPKLTGELIYAHLI